MIYFESDPDVKFLTFVLSKRICNNSVLIYFVMIHIEIWS